jgi:hypothetical protein
MIIISFVAAVAVAAIVTVLALLLLLLLSLLNKNLRRQLHMLGAWAKYLGYK